jgi:hypothetical protein
VSYRTVRRLAVRPARCRVRARVPADNRRTRPAARGAVAGVGGPRTPTGTQPQARAGPGCRRSLLRTTAVGLLCTHRTGRWSRRRAPPGRMLVLADVVRRAGPGPRPAPTRQPPAADRRPVESHPRTNRAHLVGSPTTLPVGPPNFGGPTGKLTGQPTKCTGTGRAPPGGAGAGSTQPQCPGSASAAGRGGAGAGSAQPRCPGRIGLRDTGSPRPGPSAGCCR